MVLHKTPLASAPLSGRLRRATSVRAGPGQAPGRAGGGGLRRRARVLACRPPGLPDSHSRLQATAAHLVHAQHQEDEHEQLRAKIPVAKDGNRLLCGTCACSGLLAARTLVGLLPATASAAWRWRLHVSAGTRENKVSPTRLDLGSARAPPVGSTQLTRVSGEERKYAAADDRRRRRDRPTMMRRLRRTKDRK